jgi:hypothetical protein
VVLKCKITISTKSFFFFQNFSPSLREETRIRRQYSQPEGSGPVPGCPQCQARIRAAGHGGSWTGLNVGTSSSGGSPLPRHHRAGGLGHRQASVSACGECIASIAADTVKFNGGLRQFKQVLNKSGIFNVVQYFVFPLFTLAFSYSLKCMVYLLCQVKLTHLVTFFT